MSNGIGGKIDEGETSGKAMTREFQEETGVIITDWKFFCSITNTEINSPSGPWVVYFFKAFGVATLQSPTDEKVCWWNVQTIANRLNNYFVPNLRW